MDSSVRGRNSTRLSIKNIGGILLGIRNDTGREISGEIWVNEIHLGDPLVRAGWARRGDMSVSLGRIVKVRGGYASQDKDFESGAGEVGRQRLSSRGYSTTNDDFNIDADITLFPWLPIRYGIRRPEHRNRKSARCYSSFQSGKSEIRTRDFSVQFNQNPYPNLGFAYNYQDFWNERQGTQISHLYTGKFPIRTRFKTRSQRSVSARRLIGKTLKLQQMYLRLRPPIMVTATAEIGTKKRIVVQ